MLRKRGFAIDFVVGRMADVDAQELDESLAAADLVVAWSVELNRVPGLVEASFSALMPNTHLKEHAGPERGLVRCHLGLHVPEACGFRVGDATTTWTEGAWLAFDDTTPHEAWNLSASIRVVLMMDVDRKAAGIGPDLAIARDLIPGPARPQDLG